MALPDPIVAAGAGAILPQKPVRRHLKAGMSYETLVTRRILDPLQMKDTVIAVYPESETGFFYKAVDAQVTFVKDACRQVTGLIVHQGGRDTPGKEIR